MMPYPGRRNRPHRYKHWPIGEPQSICYARNPTKARAGKYIQSSDRPQHLLQQHSWHCDYRPAQLSETRLTSGYRPGEGHSCITLNCLGGSILENVSFDNIHLTFGGGGTAEDAARRDLPPYAGEYFALGPMPAYGFYACNSRGLTLQNIRFQFGKPDLRPALIFDNVEDAAINSISVQADASAESALRFINAKDVLLTAPRLITVTSVFLQVEGTGNERIRIDGGDISKAATTLSFKSGAKEKAVGRRE